METLRYADEVKKPEQAFDGITKKTPDKDLVDLAQELIEKKAADFHPEKFKDTYTVALKELIEAKLEKRPPKAIEEAPPASNVINLMDALKRSVKGGAAAERSSNGSGKKGAARGKARAKPKAAAKSAKRKSGKKAA
jgi:DNA end-binding protein Ku